MLLLRENIRTLARIHKNSITDISMQHAIMKVAVVEAFWLAGTTFPKASATSSGLFSESRLGSNQKELTTAELHCDTYGLRSKRRTAGRRPRTGTEGQPAQREWPSRSRNDCNWTAGCSLLLIKLNCWRHGCGLPAQVRVAGKVHQCK